MGVVGLIGILVSFAGAHLLWQARRELLYWLDEFFRILRGEFTRRGATDHAQEASVLSDTPATSLPEPVMIPAESEHKAGPGQSPKGTLRLVAGFALMFLGPVLFLLDRAF